MPLILRPAELADIAEIVDVWQEAFKGSSPLDPVLFPGTPSVKAWWRSVYEKDLRDPSAHFLKVVDTDHNDRIAAYGKWYFPISGPNGTQTMSSASLEELKRLNWPEELSARLCLELFGNFIAIRERIMGKPLRPHLYLERVGVRPEYRGSGVGRQVIEWGLKEADKRELEAYVEAHQGVVKLYEKFGWQAVHNYENREIGHVETFMVRPVRATTTIRNGTGLNK